MNQKLNKAQKEAVKHVFGPMLVLAGPGSGKTTVIAERILYLTEVKKINPIHILVITFTKASAREMKERFVQLNEQDAKKITFGTFHGVFFQILKHSYHFTGNNIIREEEKYAFMKECLAQNHLETEDEAELILGLYSEISIIKNMRIQLNNYHSTLCASSIFISIYESYEAFLRANRKIDYDDMLVYTYSLFEQRKDILKAWQNKYQYILIDEFQDVNQIQFEIVKMLASPKDNIFAVGDDDQSIYHFRGAKPEIMLSLKTHFTQLKIISLSMNYRSKTAITKAAQNVISYNEIRYDKQINSKHKESGDLFVQSFGDQRAQNLSIIKQLKLFPDQFEKTAILYRTNTQIRLLVAMLLEHNIPFVSKDTIVDFYEHWVVKDIFTYIKIARGSRKRTDFLKIMNRPNRYLRRESMIKDEVSFVQWKLFYREQDWIRERILLFEKQIEQLKTMRPFAAIYYIRKQMKYDDFLKTYADERNIKVEELLEIADTISEMGKEFDSFEQWTDHILNFKKEIKATHIDKENKGITLATYHSAKGLEFERVFMVDLNEGITPYKKAVLPSEIEEERRMFYVGMTRAKSQLYLYTIQELNHQKIERSRFLQECLKPYSSSSISSNNSSKRAETASYSSSSTMFSKEGFPSSSSK